MCVNGLTCETSKDARERRETRRPRPRLPGWLPRPLAGAPGRPQGGIARLRRTTLRLTLLQGLRIKSHAVHWQSFHSTPRTPDRRTQGVHTDTNSTPPESPRTRPPICTVEQTQTFDLVARSFCVSRFTVNKNKPNFSVAPSGVSLDAPVLCFEGGLPKHENTKHRPVPRCAAAGSKHNNTKHRPTCGPPKTRNTRKHNAPGVLIASDCV